MPELGPDVANLTLTVENISPFILRTKIGAPGRWEVPRSLFNAPNLTGAAALDFTLYMYFNLKLQHATLLYFLCKEVPADAWTAPAASGGPASYMFNYSASPFSFAVSRGGSNADPVFNTAGTRLIFKVRSRLVPWRAIQLPCFFVRAMLPIAAPLCLGLRAAAGCGAAAAAAAEPTGLSRRSNTLSFPQLLRRPLRCMAWGSAHPRPGSSCGATASHSRCGTATRRRDRRT